MLRKATVLNMNNRQNQKKICIFTYLCIFILFFIYSFIHLLMYLFIISKDRCLFICTVIHPATQLGSATHFPPNVIFLTSISADPPSCNHSFLVFFESFSRDSQFFFKIFIQIHREKKLSIIQAWKAENINVMGLLIWIIIIVYMSSQAVKLYLSDTPPPSRLSIYFRHHLICLFKHLLIHLTKHFPYRSI